MSDMREEEEKSDELAAMVRFGLRAVGGECEVRLPCCGELCLVNYPMNLGA